MRDVEVNFRRYAENEKEALLRTADLLEAEGWCQHHSVDFFGKRCVSQALGETIGLHGGEDVRVHSRRAQLWRDVICVLIAEPEMPDGVGTISRVVDWNDEKGRTQEQVVALLRRVASKL